MEQLLLVVSPSLGFGEMIRQALQDAGDFMVLLASSAETALQRSAGQTVSLAILDADLGEAAYLELAGQLKDSSPEMKLVLIPPDGAAPQGELQNLVPDGLLSKPFYLPDLLELVENLLPVSTPSPPSAESRPEASRYSTPPRGIERVSAGRKSSIPHAPRWFQDADQVQQALDSRLADTPAYAALVLRYDRLWAASGKLLEAQAKSLAVELAPLWSQGEGADLARFVSLQEIEGECMLYATHLGDEFVLAVVFEAETPFSTIRRHSAELARSFKTPPAETEQEPAG